MFARLRRVDTAQRSERLGGRYPPYEEADTLGGLAYDPHRAPIRSHTPRGQDPTETRPPEPSGARNPTRPVHSLLDKPGTAENGDLQRCGQSPAHRETN